MYLILNTSYKMNMGKLKAGAAKICITPPERLMPAMSNFNILFEGVYSNLFVRTLILDNGQRQVVYITYDSPDMSRTDEIRQMLTERCGLEPQSIFFAATHTHEAPTFSTEHPMVKRDPKMLIWAKEYGDFVLEQTVACVKNAQLSLRPAKYGFGVTNSYINVNRDQLFEDGIWGQGRDFEGASDKALSVIKVEDQNGKMIGGLLNYAVHGTSCFLKKDEKNEKYLISGDVPGMVSQYLEERYATEDAVFLWTSGAAGNQNPIFFSHYQKYEHDLSHDLKYDMGYGAWSLCEHMAQTQAVDAIRAMNAMKHMRDDMHIEIKERYLALPGQKIIYADVENQEIKHMHRREILRIDDREPVNLNIKLLTIDDHAFINLNCELCCEIGIRLKEAVPLKDSVIVTHSLERTGYLPDKAAYDKRTLAFYSTPVKDGLTESLLIPEVLNMFEERHVK